MVRTLVSLLLLCAAVCAADDPLPSWNDTAPKRAVLDYVARVTAEGSPDFIPSPERIAVFDNDGTLWPENPVPFQLDFSLDEIRRLLPENPAWKDDPAVEAALAGDLPALTADHYAKLQRLLALAGSGMTTVEYADRVRQWFATARHPRFDRPYDRLAYQPMLELLAHLRANGFKTFIVSGGGADFMRVFTERVYGIPPEQVVGSNTRAVFELREDGPVLVKTMDDLFVDDGAGKPAGIHQFIGRRPVAAFGNSDGDKAMLEYTTIANPRPSFGLIVHHTDGEREYAYDAKPRSSGKLVEALAEAPRRGWVVVDMKDDWRQVFPTDPEP
jgi:phosphoglycolate phosphatase-like HAD superfamily hydrolase